MSVVNNFLYLKYETAATKVQNAFIRHKSTATAMKQFMD